VVEDITLGTIFRGIAPFVLASLVVLLLVVFVPSVALFLPRLM